MSTAAWIVIAIIAAAVVIAAILYFTQTRRSRGLRKQFGPEYDRTVRESDTRREAEAELERRSERVSQLQIRPLSADDRDRFAGEWRAVQTRFVDDPAAAVADADALIGDVMQTRGYPVGDFEQRAADISVDHPDVVSNYREAHRLAMLNSRGEASTEDLRRSMVHYRSLFDDLLGEQLPTPVAGTDGETANA